MSAMFARAIELLVYCTIVLTPLVVDLAAREPFRYPKELMVRAGAILIAGVLGAGLALGALPWPAEHTRHRILLTVGAIVTWTAITSAAAVNRMPAIGSLALVCAYTVVFIATCMVVNVRRSFTPVVILLLPAVINALVLLLQALKIWSPFEAWLGMTDRASLVALLGNPNDVGGYLAPAVVVAVALALVTRNAAAWIASLLLLAGVVGTESLTAIAAVIAGLGAMLVVRLGRRGLVASIALVVIISGMAGAYTPVRSRAVEAFRAVRAGEATLMSNRLTAFAAAAGMIGDHPVFGVGPGGFGFQYFDYKIRAEERYPALKISMSRSTNFGEAHNEHLQIAAEAGVIGYLLFLAVFAVTAAPSLHRTAAVASSEFARLASLPLATVLFVSSLAHFPLQIAASALFYVCAFAITTRWSTADDET